MNAQRGDSNAAAGQDVAELGFWITEFVGGCLKCSHRGVPVLQESQGGA